MGYFATIRGKGPCANPEEVQILRRSPGSLQILPPELIERCRRSGILHWPMQVRILPRETGMPWQPLALSKKQFNSAVSK